jgi:hypothetical protein
MVLSALAELFRSIGAVLLPRRPARVPDVPEAVIVPPPELPVPATPAPTPPQAPDKRTRGVRTNNPGNLRATKVDWYGQVGVDSYGMCIFDTPENGIRALARQLLAYYNKYGLRTVDQIISRWAPPSENNTTSYIVHVANELGVNPQDRLMLPGQTTVKQLTVAIIRHECAGYTYPDDVINQGVTRACMVN